MSHCPHTGITVPECSCARCIERQLEQFAPRLLSVQRIHDPLRIDEVRSVAQIPPVSERLTRPAL